MLQTNNESEENTLIELKRITQDLKQDEPTLIRYLKARDYDLCKTEKMLRDSMKWREENEIDEIPEWNAPQYLRSEMPFRITGEDHEGGPIMWIPFGIWNARPYVEQGCRDEMLKWGNYIMEVGTNYIKNNRNGRYQANVILGLEELSYYTVSHIETLKTLYAACKVFEACYPEIVKRIIIINAPWIFNVPYNFVKAIIHANTLKKLKVFGCKKNEWMQYLLEIAPRKSLPEEYFKDENGN